MRSIAIRLKAVAAATLAFPLVVLGWSFFVFSRDMCGNTELERHRSPDGQSEAVVFLRSCGVTTDTLTHVSIVEPGTINSDPGNALSLSVDKRASKQPSTGQPQVRVTWRAPSEVELVYSTEVVLVKAEALVRNVHIRHIRKAERAA
jgi:hypothetical protein